MTSIASAAFGYCSNLISIEIPKNTTDINVHAFSGYRNLTIHGYAETYALNNRIAFIAKVEFLPNTTISVMNLSDTQFLISVYDDNFKLIKLYAATTFGNAATALTLSDVSKAELEGNVKIMMWSDAMQPYIQVVD